MISTIDFIRIKNSFAHTDTTIKFEAGCNYVIGNYGSGKSELLEMIGFAYFGTVALRGKATTYSKLEVTLQFNYAGITYKIIRTVKDGSISVDKEVKANTTTGINTYIISLLGYDYSIYTLSNYCQQGKLQYFSELSPANRSKYIDKLNGIEDAKTFSIYLKDTKRTLKASLDAYKSLLRPPEDLDIDMELDYEKELRELPTTSTVVTDLTQQLTDLTSTIKSVPKQPIKPNIDLLELEDYESVLNKYKEYITIEGSISNLEKEIISIKSQFSRKVLSSTLTLDRAKADLEYALKNSLVSIDLSCPSCTHIFNTDIFKSKDFVSQYSIPELESIILWLDIDLQNQLRVLEKDISVLEKSLTVLGIDTICDKYPSIDIFTKSYNNQKKDYEYYLYLIEEIKNITGENQIIRSAIEEINSLIQDSISSQKVIVDKQRELLRCKSEKDVYVRLFAIHTEAILNTVNIQSKIDIIDILLDKINSIVDSIQKESLPAISNIASMYLERLTRGVLHKIEVTDTYDLLVDGVPINVRSGAQKDLSSLAFRLSLGQSIVHGILPLFIGDEIDAASTPEVSAYIRKALQELSLDGTQIIIVTHKDTTNYDNCNIIDLG